MTFDDCKCSPKDNYYLRICRIHGVLAEKQSLPKPKGKNVNT